MKPFSKSSLDILGHLVNRVSDDVAKQVSNPCSYIISLALQYVETDSNNELTEKWKHFVEAELNKYNCFESNEYGYTLDENLSLIDYSHSS